MTKDNSMSDPLDETLQNQDKPVDPQDMRSQDREDIRRQILGTQNDDSDMAA